MKNREPRRKVCISARMRAESGWTDVLIQNMSAHGLMGRSRQICARGTVLEIRRANHVIIGRVVWSHEGSFGVRTSDAIDIDQLVSTDKSNQKATKDPTTERRQGERITQQSLAATADRSSFFSRHFQSTALAAACIGGAGLLGYSAWAVIEPPMQAIYAALSGG